MGKELLVIPVRKCGQFGYERTSRGGECHVLKPAVFVHLCPVYEVFMKQPVDEFRYRSAGQSAGRCEPTGRGFSGVKELPKYHPFGNRHTGIREFAGEAVRDVIGDEPEPEARVACEATCGLRGLRLHIPIIVYLETVVKELLAR